MKNDETKSKTKFTGVEGGMASSKESTTGRTSRRDKSSTIIIESVAGSNPATPINKNK